jgi:hypothetical protein
MRDIPWSKPVRIKMPHGMQRNVEGPVAALDLLNQEWPARRGRHYEAAKSVCRAALERMTSAEAAREIFISASIEAAVAVH